MFRDEFKERYTTIPFAIYRAHFDHRPKKGFPHQHMEAEIIAVLEGNVDFYMNGCHYEMKKGDIGVILPYAIHSASVTGECLTAYYCICFDLKLLSDEALVRGLLDNVLSVASPLIREENTCRVMADYIERAFLACEEQEKGWELISVGNISLVFGMLKKTGVFAENLKDKREKEFGKKIMEYIHHHFAEEITSRTVAEALFLNQSYFCRLFKQTFGCCFAEYITVYRLEKARMYLENTRMSISDIALRSGFNSCSYFNKVFKEKYAISPLQYRKK